MTITEIAHFSAESSSTKHNSLLDTLQKAGSRRTIQREDGLKHFTVGTQVQNKDVIQITSELEDVKDSASSESPIVSSLRNTYGEPQKIYHVAFNRSPFGTEGPAEANVVEYAQNYFPASQVTPEFQRKIEADFLKFDEMCSQHMEGRVGKVAFGWVLEKQDQKDIIGEKASCFLVARGWESMEHFEAFVRTNTFKEAIQILFAWNAPYEMWHVERKAKDEQ